MQDLISIVIPIYNIEKYLTKCIETVIHQTYKNLEIILVDDGSIDSSGAICDEYAKRDSRVKVIHKINGGLSDARNAGIKVANGKYIAFLDGDDYVDNTMYEKLYESIKTNNADICVCGYTRIYGEKEIEFPLNVNKYNKDKTFLYNMIGTQPSDLTDISVGMSVWKCLYDLDIIKKNNIFYKSEKIYTSEDIIFQIEYFDFVKKVVLVGEPLYKYRFIVGSLTNRYKKDRFEKQKILYLKIISMLEERNLLSNEVKNRLNRTFFMKIKSCIKLEVVANKQEKSIRLQNIRDMLNDELVEKNIKEYPIMQSNFKNRIYLLLIKYKMVKLLYIFYKRKGN